MIAYARLAALAFALLALGTAGSRAANPPPAAPATQQTPAAAPAVQQTPPPKDKQKPPCIYAKYQELFAQSAAVPHHSLITTTRLVGAGSQTELVLTGASDTNLTGLDFRVFFVKPDVQKKNHDTKPPEGDARLVAENLTGTKEKTIAAKLQIQEEHNALLQVDVVPDASDGSWYQHDGHIVIVACKAGKTADETAPVFWAETSYYTLSPIWFPVAAGIAVVLLLYLFCAGVVYFSRKAQAKADQDKQNAQSEAAKQKRPMTPYRIETLEEWSFWRCLDPVSLTSDIFDRGSLSNLQILFFSLLVSYGLIYIVLQTGELSSISFTVVELLGVSAIGSLGAKVVGTNRNRLGAENWAWLVSRQILPLNDPGKGKPHWRDLVMSDTELDLYKLQALTFSVIVGMGLIVGGFTLATFSVPEELLEVLGLSQLVFVGGRLTKPASMGDLDDLLTELRKRESALKRAAATGVDVDGAGEPLANPPARPDAAPKPPFKTVQAAAATDAVPTATRRYLETMVQVKAFLEAMASRKIMNTSQLEDPLKEAATPVA